MNSYEVDTYTKEEIDKLLYEQQVRRDISRGSSLVFSLQKGKEEKEKEENTKSELEYGDILNKIINKVRSSGGEEAKAIFTDDEIRALLAFENSSSGQPSQGGVFSSPRITFMSWIQELSEGGMDVVPSRNKAVPSGNNVITRVENTDFFCFVRRDEYFDRLVINETIENAEIFLYYEYNIKKKSSNFTYEMNSRYEMKIEKTCLEKHIIPRALERLKKIEFKPDELYLLIPFLGNEEFAKAFTDKLKSDLPHESRLKEIHDAITLCFGVNSPPGTQFNFWGRNKRKIIGLVVVGVVIAIVISATGLAGVLFSVLGGVISGVVAGVPIGKALDKQHLSSLLLAQLKRLPALIPPKITGDKESNFQKKPDPLLSLYPQQRSLGENNSFSPALGSTPPQQGQAIATEDEVKVKPSEKHESQGLRRK